MPYTQYGPLIDGTAPGLDASFFNGIESALLAINAFAFNTAVAPTVFSSGTTSGITAGTVSMWSLAGPTIGSAANCFKLYLFYFSAYENTTGVRLHIALPSPFATGGMAWVGGIHVPTSGRGIYTVDNTGTGHHWNTINGYNTALSQDLLPCYAHGEFNNVMYFMDVDGSTTGPANGWVILMGI